MTTSQKILKRFLDLLITLILLPPTLIVMGIVSVVIWLDNPGPILFRQKRLGENQIPFEIYKFRTMVVNAEELNHLVEYYDEDGNFLHKSEDDPRVTRVGNFLRKTHLDEIPQVLNILKGDISLVGPRPEVYHLLEQYEDWQLQRFSVPQGLTGWWQINGNDHLPIYMHVEDDLYYIENYSSLFDLKILILTLGLVCKRFSGSIFR